MRRDIDTSLLDMDPEQEDFIRLLREKAEDTPVPMALEPSMMMARLQAQTAKKKVSWLKVLSPVAMAVTACFAMVLAGRSGDLDATVPVVSDPPSQVEVSTEPSSEIEESSDVTEPSSEVEEPSSEPEEVPSVSDGADTPSSEPAEDNGSDSTVSEPETGGSPIPEENIPSSEPSADAEIPEVPSDEQTDAPADAPEENVPQFGAPIPEEETYPVSYSGDYGSVYRALQSAATLENAQNHYATRVLSAGISADGLQLSNEKAIVCEGDGYFYVSHQNSTDVTVIGADGSCSSFTVQFNTPQFDGLTASSSVITHCEVVNGQLFVAGTITYARGNITLQTVSALSVYDLSDPAEPRLAAANAQDGSMIGLTEVDGYLYLFSRYYPDTTVSANSVGSYVPYYYGTAPNLVSAEDIAISDYSDTSYIVATVYSSKVPSAPCDILALQGGGENYYLSESGLYLFGEHYEDNIVYTGVSALKCRKGSVVLAGEAEVPGVLNRSDSPNEYNGTLRILTTTYGAENATNLFIFDSNLRLLGSKEGLAENRILRSVRFERSKLYFSVYEDRSATYALDLMFPQNMGDVYEAERSEEALKAVLIGDKALRLSGALGRDTLSLTLKDGSEQLDKAVIPLSGTYSEESVSLQTYEKGKYAAVTYTDGGTQTQVVRLYAVEEDRLREIVAYECSVWYGGVRAYMQDGKFYVVSFAKTVWFDVADGSQIGKVEY